MSWIPRIQEVGTERDSIITSSVDDAPIFLFTLVTLVCVGLFLVGRHLLGRQMRREARSRRHEAARSRGLSSGPDAR
jgi:hypothetical protein